MGFPLGEEGRAAGAEVFEFVGQTLGLFGGDEMAEGFFAGGDAGVNGGEFGFDGGDAVFELLELDGIEALDGGWR